MTEQLDEHPSGALISRGAPATDTATLLRVAVEHGAGIEQLRELAQLHRDMDADEARRAHAQAVADARAELPAAIPRRGRVDYTGKHGRTQYAHVRLCDVVDAAAPVLASHGLSWSWRTQQHGDQITVSCHLVHARGHETTAELTAPADIGAGRNIAQAICSTVTYLERYTLVALLGLAGEDQDDDASPARDASFELRQEIQSLFSRADLSEEQRKWCERHTGRAASVASLRKVRDALLRRAAAAPRSQRGTSDRNADLRAAAPRSQRGTSDRDADLRAAISRDLQVLPHDVYEPLAKRLHDATTEEELKRLQDDIVQALERDETDEPPPDEPPESVLGPDEV